MARADALETHTVGIPHSARVVILEISVGEAKCGTRANKRRSYFPTTMLETHTLWCTTCSVGKDHKDRARKRVVNSSDPQPKAYANKRLARSFESKLEARALSHVVRLSILAFNVRVHYEW